MTDIPYIEVNNSKTSPDYQKGIIIKLSSLKSDKCYISYSGLPYDEFKNEILKNYIEYKAGRHGYVKYFELIDLGYNDFIIEIIENYSCNSKTDLIKKRNEYIKRIPNCINNDKIDEIYKSPKLKCECGSLIQSSRISDHYKSLKHKKFMNI